jgi:AcrR family transcriptional regulator
MKRGQHHGALKPVLVEAGLGLLDSEGVEAVTIRAVARQAGVSHAAPVNHFPDRRALLTAIATHCFEELKRAIANTEFRRLPTARERIFALIDAFYAYGLARPNRYRLMWRQDLLDAADPAIKGLTDDVFDLVARSLASFEDPPRISAMSRIVAVCSAIHGYVLLRIDGNFDSYVDERTGQPRHYAIVEALLP